MATPLPPGALARMGTQRLQTIGRVLAFSPDEKLFAAVSPESRLEDVFGGEKVVVRLWSVASGLPVRRLDGPAFPVGDGVFSADGKTFLATGNEQTVAWRVADGKRVRETRIPGLNHSDSCRPVLSRDGKRWVSLGPIGMHVGETATGKAFAPWRTPQGSEGWNAISLSADGKRAGGFMQDLSEEKEDNRADVPVKGRWVVWDVATRKALGKFAVKVRKADICPGGFF